MKKNVKEYSFIKEPDISLSKHSSNMESCTVYETELVEGGFSRSHRTGMYTEIFVPSKKIIIQLMRPDGPHAAFGFLVFNASEPHTTPKMINDDKMGSIKNIRTKEIPNDFINNCVAYYESSEKIKDSLKTIREII